MRRTVEARLADGPPVGPALRSAALAVALALAAWAPAGAVGGVDGEGPELSPPAGMPATPKPAAPARARAGSPPAGGNRAVLALPGITAPSSPGPAVITSRPSEGAPAAPGDFPLDGPIEMPGASPAPRPRPAAVIAPTPKPARAARPMDLEPLPMDATPTPGEPSSRATLFPRRSPIGLGRPDPSPPPPARRGRFFGLGPGPVVASPASKLSAPGRAVADEAPEDAAAEAALKRRIEKQARLAVGDRARAVEVRVDGKAVEVQAKGVRFYQKRAVRKSLESLPALSGLRSSIEVGD